MTQPGISIPITAEGSDFDRELSRVVMDALRDVQRELNAHPLTFGIQVDPDFTGFRQQVATELAAIQGSSDFRLTIPVDLDAAGAIAQMQAVHQQLQAQASPITQHVRVEADRSGVDQLQSGLRGVGATAGVGAAVAGGLAAIGGAAGAAAGAVGGLAVGLAALGPALAGIAGTAVVAFQGIGGAFSAMSAMSDNAGKEAAAQADAVASAVSQLESAQESARSASRAYTQAQEDQTDANKELADSYETAADNLEDLQFKQRGAVIDQKDALLDLREAQRDLAKAGRSSDPDAYARAVTRLEKAQLRYDQSVTQGQRTQEELNDAQAKGIDNSDAVTAAKEKQQDATERVAEAERAAARANDQVTKAQQALTKAQTEGTPSAQKFADALAKLAPSAQAFVLAAQAAKPAWEEVQRSVQQTVFEGLGQTLTDLADNVLPTLGEGMKGVAAEFNAGAQGFAGFLQAASGIGGLEAAFAGAQNFMRGLREESTGFLSGLSTMTQAAAPFAEGIGRAFGSIGNALGDAFSAISESGLLEDVMTGLATALEGIGPLLGDMIIAFSTLAAEVLPALAPLFDAFGMALTAIAPSLGELGSVFASSLALLMPSLSTFISALADGLQPVLPILAGLLQTLFTAAAPLIGPLSEIAVTVGTALIGAIKALEPALLPVANAFSALITAVAPLVPVIAQAFSTVLQALAPALEQVFNALAPVIASLAQQLGPVIEELAPVLAEVAMTLGMALADAIKQIAPYLPQIVQSFTQLLLAITPLLPELTRLAAQILPPLINVFIQMLPFILRAVDLFTRLIEEVVIPLVIPIMQQMADNIERNLNTLATVLEWWWGVTERVLNWVVDKWNGLKDTLSGIKDWFTDTLFPAFQAGLDKVKGWFESGVDGIKNAWDKLKEAAAVPVRFVVNTIWNEGLLKAWNSVAGFLPGIDPMEKVTLGFARGGGVHGPGSGTSDSIPAWLSAGEHVVTAAEVLRAGGQNVLYAIRDMISRGVPFEWDGGRVVSKLGRDNLSAYGAAVRQKGIGNVSPEGLFDPLGFRDGGAVLPWMEQLMRGHKFAKAQHGKPYQWAGPRFVGDSFDCSGFMGSIAAAILGGNPWTRYWATGSFGRGQRASGPQGFVAGTDNGFTIGVTDDPGGPGGGHTAGTLGAIPALGIGAPVNVESGGSLGNVHYGGGPDPRSFLAQYHLPIGANGFFQPGAGGGSVGPSPDEQRGFLASRVREVFKGITDPVRSTMRSVIGEPPPKWREIPPEFLTTAEDKAISYLSGVVSNLGDLLPQAWSSARETVGNVLDAVNPFDSGGVANGVGIMAKNVIDPERVLSPEQTRLFEALVLALQQLAGGGAAIASAGLDALGAGIGKVVGDTLADLIPEFVAPEREGPDTNFMETQRAAMDELGRIRADTLDLVQRTLSSDELVAMQQTEQIMAGLSDIGRRLTGGVLGPIVQSAMDGAIEVVKGWLGAGFNEVTAGTDRTTNAVEGLDAGVGAAPVPFGQPGSAFDAAAAISDAVVSVANTAQQTFAQVAQDVANAALAQHSDSISESRGNLGTDVSGGLVADLIVRLTGAQIEVRDLLVDTLEEVRGFKGENARTFDEAGRIVADTAELVNRTESSMEIALAEQNRLNRELLKAVLRYLMTSVVIPIMTAVLGAMITLAVTAIGAAIGSIIPGIGTAIGAAIGAVVGAALGGAAAVFTATLAVGAAAAIDSFDEGGVAHGIGYMPKNTIAPERVLSPRQTESFDRLVSALERGNGTGSRTVNAPIAVYGDRRAGENVQNRLLSLL
ncbi:hypothetical protein [Nocardia carnea]|uniref:hypothetical protein n=1 Tax=Nocardia carnea TaxID=37328 RepID=UPI0024573362|nr:hypothetical protein [Nocardia carnea]